jgi:hypothetical protein
VVGGTTATETLLWPFTSSGAPGRQTTSAIITGSGSGSAATMTAPGCGSAIVAELVRGRVPNDKADDTGGVRPLPTLEWAATAAPPQVIWAETGTRVPFHKHGTDATDPYTREIGQQCLTRSGRAGCGAGVPATLGTKAAVLRIQIFCVWWCQLEFRAHFAKQKECLHV